MFSHFVEISPIGVLAATVAMFLFAGIWYGALIPKLYAQAMQIQDRPEVMKKPIYMFGNLPFVLLIVVTNAFLLRVLRIETISDAVGLGIVVGIGYLFSVTSTIAINPLFPHPFRYSALTSPFFLISAIMTNVILVSIR